MNALFSLYTDNFGLSFSSPSFSGALSVSASALLSLEGLIAYKAGKQQKIYTET